MWVCLKQGSENRVLVVLLQIGAKDLTVVAWVSTRVTHPINSLHNSWGDREYKQDDLLPFQRLQVWLWWLSYVQQILHGASLIIVNITLNIHFSQTKSLQSKNAICFVFLGNICSFVNKKVGITSHNTLCEWLIHKTMYIQTARM